MAKPNHKSGQGDLVIQSIRICLPAHWAVRVRAEGETDGPAHRSVYGLDQNGKYTQSTPYPHPRQTLIINQRPLPAGLGQLFTMLNTELHLESSNLGTWDEICDQCHRLPSYYPSLPSSLLMEPVTNPSPRWESPFPWLLWVATES